MGWKPMIEAPRNGAAVKLFLPSAKYRSDEAGRPHDVDRGECIGVWDSNRLHWVDRTTRAKVYPSQWTECEP